MDYKVLTVLLWTNIIDPVSYTHLDVYKRKAPNRSLLIWPPGKPSFVTKAVCDVRIGPVLRGNVIHTPVSYTHLNRKRPETSVILRGSSPHMRG